MITFLSTNLSNELAFSPEEEKQTIEEQIDEGVIMAEESESIIIPEVESTPSGYKILKEEHKCGADDDDILELDDDFEDDDFEDDCLTDDDSF